MRACVRAVAVLSVLASVLCKSSCEFYDHLTARTIKIEDADLANMNFVYADDYQVTYLSLCTPLDQSIVVQAGINDTSKQYSFISCRSSACFGLTFDDIVSAIPKKPKNNNQTVVRILYKHPVDDIPILISFPDDRNATTDRLDNSVRYENVRDSKEEYEPISYHNYTLHVKASAEVLILDTYYFGAEHYINSWVWTILAVSFMVSSACFHNYATTSGRLSSFVYFIYFYVCYRVIDSFYNIVYSPNIIIATTSVIIFPGVVAYVFSNLENKDANNTAFGTV